MEVRNGNLSTRFSSLVSSVVGRLLSEDGIRCEILALSTEGNSAHSRGRPARGGLPAVLTHLWSTFFFSFQAGLMPFFLQLYSFTPSYFAHFFLLYVCICQWSTWRVNLRKIPFIEWFPWSLDLLQTRILTTLSKMAQSFTPAPTVHLLTCKKQAPLPEAGSLTYMACIKVFTRFAEPKSIEVLPQREFRKLLATTN